MLVHNTYGKARVRLFKILRKDNSIHHDVKQLTVQVLLEGDFDSSYTSPNNSSVVPTDTCKNLVYVIARDHPLDSIESFGLSLGQKFLHEYSHVFKVNIEIIETLWKRLEVGEKPHSHSFERKSQETRTAKVISMRGQNAQVESGINDLIVLKTTGSGFVGFHHCKYTVLPEIDDRILATSVQAKWTYLPTLKDVQNIDYNSTWSRVRQLFFQIFSEEYSHSVQQTLYSAAKLIIQEIPEIFEISFRLPNIHYWNIDFSKFNMAPSKDLFIPTDEPHGLIGAVIRRPTAKL